MKQSKVFDNVWDALEDDPVKAENMKLRAELMMAINQKVEVEGLTQAQAAEKLCILQPRVSALAHLIH